MRAVPLLLLCSCTGLAFRPPARLRMSGEGPSEEGVGRLSRQGLLKGVGTGLGALTLALGARPMPALAVKRSAKELQYELFKKALDLTQAFQFDEADKAYTEIIELFGEPVGMTERNKFLVARAYSNRGNVRSMLNRIEEALVDYSKALELAPDCSEFWVNRGLAYETVADGLLGVREADAMQFYEVAMQDYDHAIVLDPNNHRLYMNAGDVLTRLHRHESALDHYRQALSLFPISPASRAKVALMEVQIGNLERGYYIMDTLVRRNPEYAEMMLASAAIEWTSGRFAESRDTYSAAIERDPRLLDDEFLKMSLHWPPRMLGMVRQLRDAGAMSGYRARAVSWFDSGRDI